MLFGTVLENVMVDPATRELDFQSGAVTENTRAVYPAEFIDRAVIPGVGGHPRNIVFLAAGAFGVLPPIARLTRKQAVYDFLSGYTAKVAGTERGLSSAPEATFSACFAAPSLPRPPREYAALLGHGMDKHAVNRWLVNTGWVGGPHGVGERMKLAFTRAMLNAARRARPRPQVPEEFRAIPQGPARNQGRRPGAVARSSPRPAPRNQISVYPGNSAMSACSAAVGPVAHS